MSATASLPRRLQDSKTARVCGPPGPVLFCCFGVEHERYKVVDFPKGEIADEEKVRRVMVEVDRLVRLTPNEWKLCYRRSAASLGVTPEVLRDLIEF